MKLFVGLGNPGPKYENTRHNIGFLAVDAIADRHGFSPWRGKFQGEICEGKLGTQKLLLLKPMTFMNLSGQSIGEAARFYKIAPEDVCVFHDELDLAPGKLKVKMGGGHAGHNGLRSTHEHIGAQYQRVRIGIGHPGDKRLVSNYVLHDFAKADQDWIEPLLAGICEGAPLLAAGDAGGFMNKVALRMQPPKSEKPQPKPVPRRPEDTGAQRPETKVEHKPETKVEDTTSDPLARLAARFRKDRP
ncbi:MAG: aminoacyl-tRNA hydrolase [Neomegalonema sp.]|nr:aminoacyl-tRNA hydrolase [Neomegalonema sp.]